MSMDCAPTQIGRAREGIPDAEDSCISHLSAESSVRGICYGSSAPGTPLRNPTARIRSAPPARVRVGSDRLGTEGNQFFTAHWITSVPGRFPCDPSHGVAPLSIYSAANSVASSRVPSGNAKLSSRETFARGVKLHLRTAEAVTDAPAAKSSLQTDQRAPAEASSSLPMKRNILSARAKWKADPHVWSALSKRNHSSLHNSKQLPNDVPCQETEKAKTGVAHIAQQSISREVQTEHVCKMCTQMHGNSDMTREQGIGAGTKCDGSRQASCQVTLNTMGQSSEKFVQEFDFAVRSLAQITDGERSFELPAQFPHLAQVPVMKGKLSPAVLVQQHHLKQADVTLLYKLMHTFSYAFHDTVESLVAYATRCCDLKQAIWVGLAEIWQAGLCIGFASDIQALVKERDEAVAAAAHAAAECKHVELASAHLKAQHGMLAGKAAERLQAEAELRTEQVSLVGKVDMLQNANDKLAARVAQLGGAVRVAESLAESRLQDAQTAELRAQKFEKLIRTQNAQLDQKSALLGTQCADLKRLEHEKQCLHDRIKELSSQAQVQELQAQLDRAVQKSDALQDVARTHGKQTGLLKAQATALHLKLKEMEAENARLIHAHAAAQSKAGELLVDSRRFEAEAAALSHRLENEKMRQADHEAQAWHAVCRRNEIVQAYQPVLKRIHTAESMQQSANARAESITQDLRELQQQHAETQEKLVEMQTECERLLVVEEQHDKLLQQNRDLQAELHDVLAKTRPLRVLIAFKRHQVKTLTDQLADFHQLHAESVVQAESTRVALQDVLLQPKDCPRTGFSSAHGEELNQLGDDKDAGAESCEVDAQAQREFQQQLKTVMDRLEVVQGDLATAQVEKAGTEELLQEYTGKAQQLQSQLEARDISVAALQQTIQKLENELSSCVTAQASAESKLAQERSKLESLEQKCHNTRTNLDLVQEELNAKFKQSALRNRGLEERASDAQRSHADLSQAVLDHSNAMKSAMQMFNVSCTESHNEAFQPDANSDVLTMLLDKLAFVDDVNLEGGQHSPETKTDGAQHHLSWVASRVVYVFETLTELDFSGQMQAKDARVEELRQQVLASEADKNELRLKGDRFEAEHNRTVAELTNAHTALHLSDSAKKAMEQQLTATNSAWASLKQDVDALTKERDAQQGELKSLQSQIEKLQLELSETTECCNSWEADAATTATRQEALEAENTGLAVRAAALDTEIAELRETRGRMRLQLEDTATLLTEAQQRARENEAAASQTRATCEALEHELEEAYQELNDSRGNEAHTRNMNKDIVVQLDMAQSRIHEMQQTWLPLEPANKLRQNAQEWQARHDQIQHRYDSLADDFQHLSARKAAVEAERSRQLRHRRRVAALHAGLSTMLRDMSDLEERCCNVTQAGIGIVAWAERCVAFVDTVLKDMVDALLEHDAVVTRADIPGLLATCLSSLRQHSGLLTSGHPAASAPQLLSVERMEQRVDQLRIELSKRQDAEATQRISLENLQKENSALRQNNSDLREDLSACGRTAAAAEAASAEARELRSRVDQLTSMHQTVFARMLRLAVLASQKQENKQTVSAIQSEGLDVEGTSLEVATESMQEQDSASAQISCKETEGSVHQHNSDANSLDFGQDRCAAADDSVQGHVTDSIGSANDDRVGS
eukprot:jgi/Ulvmu1/9282/UM050_0031.1